VIEDIGCNNTINLDLLVSSGLDSIVWLTGDITNPTQIVLGLTGEAITINCGGGVCCPIGFDTEVIVTDATCTDTPNGSININPQDGTPPFTFDWSNGDVTEDIIGLLPGSYMVTITDSQGCTDELQMTVDVSPGDPAAQPAEIEICSENTEDFFDLTTVDNTVNIGSGYNVLWFENEDLTGPIGNPSNYLSPSATVYAVVDNGACLSEPVPVTLLINPSPIGMPVTINQCEEDNEMSTFQLTELDDEVSGGNGTVSWYLDPGLNNPVPDPNGFTTVSTTVYAVIDDGTCTSQPVEVTLNVDLQPIGYPTGMELCGDENDQAVFDLTLVELAVSAGNGSVSWFLEIELSDPILSPSSFQTSSTIVYAIVFDGICNSDPIPVDLIVNPTPVGIPITISQCDDGSGMATFNLWNYASQVSGGAGSVDWFLDFGLTEVVPDPIAFYTGPTVIYATVDNGICVSGPVAVQIEVPQSPVGIPATMEACADSTGQGTFDLTTIANEVSGGFGTVAWYEDDQGLNPIAVPTAYMSMGSTVYAQISASGCLSAFVPVTLSIINSVTATPAQLGSCDNGTGIAIFNLVTIESAVSGGTGQVSWYLDSLATMILTPVDSFPSGDSTVWARVTAGTCASDIVPVDLMVLNAPTSTDLTLDLCGNDSMLTTIDLTTLDTMVSGNNGAVTWFGDSLLSIPVATPSNFMTSDTIVFAVVSNGSCLSPPATIILNVSATLPANPITLEYCVPQGDTVWIDLTQSDTAIGGSYQVNWFAEPSGTISLTAPAAYPGTVSDTVYANVTDGNCVSEIVPVEIIILAAPLANSVDIAKCGDSNGQVNVDLTAVDPIVSGNTGTVGWYSDPALTIPVSNPTALITADTIVYAVVVNGFCTSPGVPVTVTVVDSLIANPVSIELCVLDTDTATIDLTQYDVNISGGSGPVFWFSDSMLSDTVMNTTAYVTTGDTLYAIVVADGCISNAAMITIEVESAATPVPLCTFTSIDSLAITWLPVTSQYQLSYSINGQVIGGPVTTGSNIFSLGGLGQGDTIMLTVSALYNGICTMPVSASATCITDVCPTQTLSFPGLASSYCRDVPFVLINTNPPGGQLSGQGISGDTLYPNQVTGPATNINYTWEETVSGCVYNLSAPVQIIDPLPTPVLTCQPSTLHSVSFDWSPAIGQFVYQYMINQGSGSGLVTGANTSLQVNNLMEGDSVTLVLYAIGNAPCGNSDTVSVTCHTLQCPRPTITITDPGLLCSDDAPLLMSASITGLPGIPVITWSGQGISDPAGIFDPSLAAAGSNTITMTATEGGCTFTDSITIYVQPQPVAAFDVSGIPCVDHTLQVQFTGSASAGALFTWDFAGGDTIGSNPPLAYSISWPAAGTYTLQLGIEDNGCTSSTFALPLMIDEPLDTPQVICLEQDYTTITSEWQAVSGATAYTATSTLGHGVLNGTTYTISQLPDNTAVEITITATGASACGPSAGTVQCQTLEYIPIKTFIPNVFSPNGDGINDVFYIQSNGEVTGVVVFRVFDRWGNAVFEDFNFLPNDMQHGWDGSFHEKEMNPAVYTYIAEVETTRGKPLVLTGDVTLIR
jgi:gliding motility-associated-like protein